MEVDVDQLMKQCLQDGIREAIKRSAEQYNSPLLQVFTSCIEAHKVAFRGLLDTAIQACIADESFHELIRSGVRQSLSKILVQRFGGELEKQVNTLKSDPTTRARIVLAIEEIVKERSSVVG